MRHRRFSSRLVAAVLAAAPVLISGPAAEATYETHIILKATIDNASGGGGGGGTLNVSPTSLTGMNVTGVTNGVAASGAMQQVTVTASGGNVTINSITASRTLPTDTANSTFVLGGSCAPGQLNNGSSCTIQITPGATTNGVISGSVTIDYTPL